MPALAGTGEQGAKNVMIAISGSDKDLSACFIGECFWLIAAVAADSGPAGEGIPDFDVVYPLAGRVFGRFGVDTEQ